MTMRLKPTAFLLTLAAISFGGARDAAAQLDPLLFLKRTQPNVLLVVDTANRMQRDPNNDYRDARVYRTGTNTTAETTLGVSVLSTNYRRKYVGLQHTDPAASSGDKFAVTHIEPVENTDGTDFTNFDEWTRLSIARRAMIAAITANQNVARFGLIKTRQLNPGMPTTPVELNDGPVKITNASSPLATGMGDSNTGKWKITRPIVSAVNGSQTTVTAPVVGADAANANTTILDILKLGVGQTSGSGPTMLKGLTPAGKDGAYDLDAPVEFMLEDAKKHANDLIAADAQCRNTAVVLILGGPEGSTASPAMTAADRAKEFLKLGPSADRRVPIYVIALWPQLTDAERTELQNIAANSGGYYKEITKAMVDAASPSATQAVPEIVRTINLAVQHAFALPTDFNAAPTSLFPYGPQTEYQVTSPIIGTVNLEAAVDINNSPLVNTRIEHPVAKTVIPQRSNVLITTAFALPSMEPGVDPDGGFRGRLRAFRVYEPVSDPKKPTGWAFKAAGTPLWIASVPAAANRNIFTALPDGTVVPFDQANLSAFEAYLNDSNPAALVDFVRSQQLGGIVTSTPAMMDPPSLDPPPDKDYPAFVEANKNRRAMIWVGANDGMLHGIDARKGVELWAFIPFNLLPKLKELRNGQAVGDFRYFVDSSPKVADVKIAGKWRTYLIMGEGSGGTFYQTFDVTLDNMGSSVMPDSDDISSALGYFARPDAVPLKWTFPLYKNFDHTITKCGPVTAQYTCWGDLATTATAVEKTVGETWSDPAVGQIESSAGVYTVLVGSGFFKYSMQQGANRNKAVAGNTFYLLNAETGAVFDSETVGSDGKAETVDNCAAAGDCTQLKNALQADPVATGPADSRFITKAYMGDLDGKIWRFDIGLDTLKQPYIKTAPVKVYDATALHPNFASMATVNVGGTQQYLFQGTGSDLLPSNGVKHSYKLLVILDGSTGPPKAEIALTITDGLAGDEKVTSFPAVAGDIVFFTTTTYNPQTPCTPFDATLYAFTFVGGPAYDTNRDGKFDAKTDSVKAKTVAGKRGTAPFIVDQHVAFGAGDKIEILGDQNDFNNGVGQAGVRILTWREVR
jgi:hypothetical protein